MNKVTCDQLKLLTIGDSGVGKTWLLLRWSGASGKLSRYSSSMPTIGIDFKMKTVVLNGKRVKVQIWDTAGQERFRTITTSYYRHCQGILLVYDITDGSSFASIRSWLSQIKQHADSNVNKLLVGNKADLEDQRVVTHAEGAKLAEQCGIPFIETSAVSGLNVDEAFTTLSQAVYERLEGEGYEFNSAKTAGSSGSGNGIASGDNRNAPIVLDEKQATTSRRCCS